MPWYELRVTPEAKRDLEVGSRSILVWDSRSKAEIMKRLMHKGFVEVPRASFRPDQLVIESKGSITIVREHLISMEDRLDLDARHAAGPARYKRGAGAAGKPDALSKTREKWADVLDAKAPAGQDDAGDSDGTAD